MPKGVVFFNPSSGAKLPPAEKRAFEEAVGKADLELVPLSGEIDVTEQIRDRFNRGLRLFIAAIALDGQVRQVDTARINDRFLECSTYSVHSALDHERPAVASGKSTWLGH